jgi:hypothetical protein
MNDLKFTLLADGSSDQVLIRHLEWFVRRQVAPTTTIQSEWADLRSIHPKPANLSERIHRAIELYPCDLLFVHRDAEKQDPQLRYDEIAAAVRSITSVAESVVSVVPVRMQEAWLLFDECAIRWAAGNPNGRDDLGLPSLSKLESLPNPKSILLQSLRKASGLAGRRLRQFRGRAAARRVAEYIQDFTPLLQLDAFQRLDSDIQAEFRRRGWKPG